MTMQIDENTIGIWYCLLIPDEQDFLLTLNRIAEEQYAITYRFRYYNSNDPFDEKDKKSWYEGEIKNETEEEVLNKLRNDILPLIAGASGSEIKEVLRGDRPFEDFMKEFMEQDFVHARPIH